ncbi:MAG: TIR domain-containing protein [Acidimicrobiia bacterium]
MLLLFWSQHAKQSKWVQREVRYALSPKNRDHGPVEIEPVLIEGPPVPKPWSELAHLHFGDRRLHAMRG